MRSQRREKSIRTSSVHKSGFTDDTPADTRKKNVLGFLILSETDSSPPNIEECLLLGFIWTLAFSEASFQLQ